MDEDHVEVLARTMADVSRLLQSVNGVGATWEAITRLAVERLDGVEHAGITIVKSGRPVTPAASDEFPGQVDTLQYELGQGPCLDAITARHTFHTNELADERQRWPDFSSRAAEELDLHSMLSFQLFVQDDILGALNFYSHRPAAFDGSVVEAGAVFAAHAALALANAQDSDEVANLRRALDSSRMIGAACGILMAHHRLTQDQAFDVLRRVSQDSNRKLRDVADDVVQTGTLPDRPRR